MNTFSERDVLQNGSKTIAPEENYPPNTKTNPNSNPIHN